MLDVSFFSPFVINYPLSIILLFVAAEQRETDLLRFIRNSKLVTRNLLRSALTQPRANAPRARAALGNPSFTPPHFAEGASKASITSSTFGSKITPCRSKFAKVRPIHNTHQKLE
jgi:hypothetical protein